VRVLVQLGADVHAQDQDGRVALQWAAVSGQAETVKALAELGADVRARDKDQLTALDWAKRNGHADTVEVLEDLVKASTKEMKDKKFVVASLSAHLRKDARRGCVDDIRKLVTDGADVHSSGHGGLTALHWAAAGGHTEVVKVLEELGADVGAHDENGRMALHLAMDKGHQETVKLLLEMHTKSLEQSKKQVPAGHAHNAGQGKRHYQSKGDRIIRRKLSAHVNRENAVRQLFLQKYSYAELANATGNFSPALKIGEGGFGKVYKGQMLGMQVAVKQLDSDSMQGQDELHRELEILGTISHRHLVHLYGWCQTERCLVYELCEKGSLEECLPQLRWHDRVRVAKEVCLGLLFLHNRKPDGVIHRDIKPSNILLDQHGTAKLADVGLGKILHKAGMDSRRTDPSYVMTSTIVGTFAYTDPEYMRTGQVSYGSDIYSLGVLFLHMLTGNSADSQVRISDFVKDTMSSGHGSFVDEAAGEWPPSDAQKFAEIALKCVEERRNMRPDLERDVLPTLEMLHARCSRRYT